MHSRATAAQYIYAKLTPDRTTTCSCVWPSQENAELLTEEGRLLQQIQGDDVVDYDIDAYAGRLSDILDRKMQLMAMLKLRLGKFRRHLEEEENVSRRVTTMPQY